MFKFYTADYEGEMVSDSLHWRDGNKDSNGVWIPKTILNDEHTKTAHIIGNGPSREKISLFLLDGQSGGEGGVTSVVLIIDIKTKHLKSLVLHFYSVLILKF